MIIIHYDPFSMTSNAYICQRDRQETRYISSNISNLVKDIAAIADELNIYSVKVDAPSSVVEEIKLQLTTTNYTKEKINVEGI